MLLKQNKALIVETKLSAHNSHIASFLTVGQKLINTNRDKVKINEKIESIKKKWEFLVEENETTIASLNEASMRIHHEENAERLALGLVDSLNLIGESSSYQAEEFQEATNVPIIEENENFPF